MNTETGAEDISEVRLEEGNNVEVSRNESSAPLLVDDSVPTVGQVPSFADNPAFQQNDEGDAVLDETVNGMPTVGCRVCGSQIPYESNTMQHVVRCSSCNEATPIRSAPTGKKFVRCPCNCLLICKVSSNRIACPRANCGRVIILQPSLSHGSSVPAPAGTARVQCYYCEEVFMFNTLTNFVAPCPHCQKKSSVSKSYVRKRSFAYFSSALLSLIVFIGVLIGTFDTFSESKLISLLWLGILALSIFFSYRFYYFLTLKISKVLGPL